MPLARFEETGQAAELMYDVPEPTSYDVRSLIELDYPASYFEVSKEANDDRVTLGDLEEDQVEARLRRAGMVDDVLFPFVRPTNPYVHNLLSSDVLRLSEATMIGDGGAVAELSEVREQYTEWPALGDGLVTEHQVAPSLRSLSRDEIERKLKAGFTLGLSRNLAGITQEHWIPVRQQPRPQLAIVERCRLSNYLGDYGAGRTVKSFSLYPGERTKIFVRTYNNSQVGRETASSIFDSVTNTASNEFQSALESEQSTKVGSTSSEERSFDIRAEVATGTIPSAWVKAKVSGGYSGTNKSTAAREQLSRSVVNATRKHANSASAKRDVQVNTSASFKQTQEHENTIERQIENINLSRTLNFVFRQLNQEFVSLYHLTDLRIAYTDGREDYREVPLYELDDLLNDVVVDEEVDGQNARQAVEDQILEQVRGIRDYSGTAATEFVGERSENGFDYYQVDDGFVTPIPDRYSIRQVDEVDGVLLSHTKNTIRTDGILVEALLGQGEALDEYSRDLQTESVRSRRSENELTEERVEKERLARAIVEDEEQGNGRAERFARVYPMPTEKEGDSTGDEDVDA